MGKTDTIQVPIFTDDAPGYEADFHDWSREQAARLRLLRIPGIDSENLAEEIESLGRSDRNKLASRIDVLLVHLLKWKYQPARRGVSWQVTIQEQRKRIGVITADSPSLARTIPDVIAAEYGYAVKLAAIETNKAKHVFPPACEWTPEQVLDAGFMPDAAPAVPEALAPTLPGTA